MMESCADLTKLDQSLQALGPAAVADKTLIKTLIFGFIVGVLGSGALAWYVPAVDLHRERSLISVLPNGGNAEVFHINLPRDRILVGISGDENSIPAELEWPGGEALGDLQAEMFKIRNRDDAVVGIASRLASLNESTGPFIEWVLHLPARGTLYAEMQITPAADGYREGVVRAGTQDFGLLSGSIREKFIAGVEEEFDIESRIEIETTLVAPLGDVE